MVLRCRMSQNVSGLIAITTQPYVVPLLATKYGRALIHARIKIRSVLIFNVFFSLCIKMLGHSGLSFFMCRFFKFSWRVAFRAGNKCAMRCQEQENTTRTRQRRPEVLKSLVFLG